MAYNFQTSDEDGIFIGRVGGERYAAFSDNFEALWAFWSGVAAEMKRKGLLRLLAVVSARGTIRSLDAPTFYRRLGEMGFLANMRLAVVADLEDHGRPVMQLGISAAARDGWNICLFASEEEARHWLLADPRSD